MIYGYARNSTQEQNLDTQIELLNTYKCDVMIEEKFTGSKLKRPELERLLKKLTDGDKLIITRVDRLGRNTREFTVSSRISPKKKLFTLYNCVRDRSNT
ncbi:recombinase family protein [Peribacillus butanolivorans]|uniref:recombinase family protein n=1 Tax=Peribacillus butanolivorans TaxID=421767 RepID=UPI0030EBC809